METDGNQNGSKYLIFNLPAEESSLVINDDRIFIFRQTVPLTVSGNRQQEVYVKVLSVIL